MNAALLSLRAFISVFISQLLCFNYFNHLVHSSVASLFNLEYILTCMLWNCFHFFLPCQFTTSKFIPSHMWRSCTPEHAASAAAVIFSLIFKPFSIFFYPLNCSLSNICLFICSFYSTPQFISRKPYILLTASLCQMPGRYRQHSSRDFAEGMICTTHSLVSFPTEQLDLQRSRHGCTNSLCSTQMISKE